MKMNEMEGKDFKDMTADEAMADLIARRRGGEIGEAEFKSLYSEYCAKRKAENENALG